MDVSKYLVEIQDFNFDSCINYDTRRCWTAATAASTQYLQPCTDQSIQLLMDQSDLLPNDDSDRSVIEQYPVKVIRFRTSQPKLSPLRQSPNSRTSNKFFNQSPSKTFFRSDGFSRSASSGRGSTNRIILEDSSSFRGDQELMNKNFKLNKDIPSICSSQEMQAKPRAWTKTTRINNSPENTKNGNTSAFRSIGREQGRGHNQIVQIKLKNGPRGDYEKDYSQVDKSKFAATLSNGRTLFPFLDHDGTKLKQKDPLAYETDFYNIDQGLVQSRFKKTQNIFISEKTQRSKLVQSNEDDNARVAKRSSSRDERDNTEGYINMNPRQINEVIAELQQKMQKPFTKEDILSENFPFISSDKDRKLKLKLEEQNLKTRERLEKKRLRIFSRFEKCFANIYQQVLDPSKVSF